MKEADFWSRYVRKALHEPPMALALKVQDAYNPGLPDAEYIFCGVVSKLELKYLPGRPARPATPLRVAVSVEQRRQLLQWRDAGGNAYVLLGVDRDWLLLDPEVPERVPEADLAPWTLARGTLKDFAALREYLTLPPRCRNLGCLRPARRDEAIRHLCAHHVGLT